MVGANEQSFSEIVKNLNKTKTRAKKIGLYLCLEEIIKKSENLSNVDQKDLISLMENALCDKNEGAVLSKCAKSILDKLEQKLGNKYVDYLKEAQLRVWPSTTASFKARGSERQEKNQSKLIN